jgi:hypothetical protein
MTAPDQDLDEIRGEFPHWHVWRGIAGILYARRMLSSPPRVVRAETPAQLHAAILAETARRPR